MPIVSANNDTVYVSVDGSDDGDGSFENPYYNITKALDDERSVIVLKNGTYNQADININKSVTIQSSGSVILDGNKTSQIFKIDKDVSVYLTNLTFINAYCSDYGGAIVNNGNLIVDNVNFINNSAFSASAIENSGTLMIKNSFFDGNEGFGKDGGALFSTGDLTIINSTFTNNVASRNGGVLAFQANKLIIINSTFNDNNAWGNDNYGGVLYLWASKSQIINSTFKNNRGGVGGAIYSGGGSMEWTELNITQSVFEDNHGYIAHDIYLELGSANINYSKILGGIVGYRSPKVDLNYNWWGVNNPDWKDLISSAIPEVYAYLNISSDGENVKTGLYWVNTSDIVTKIPELFGTIEINSSVENVEFTKEFVFGLSNITVTLDNEVQSFDPDAALETRLLADDVEMYYHDGSRFSVILEDINGNALENQSVVITVNNMSYTRVTDKKGNASIALNLNSGEYPVTVVFNSTEYLGSNTTAVVNIRPTVNGTDVVKVFRNATQYYATFRDFNGNYLSNGTNVTFNINGVFYNRTVSEKGIARLNLNLAQGEYIITAANPVTGENTANNVTILPTIAENKDIVKYFRNDTQYSVQLIGDDGKPVKAGEVVTFNINGVFYNRTTNESGFAKLNINLNPGDYIITAEYKGCRVSNNITVLPVLTAENLTKKYGTSNPFIAKLVDGQGSPLSGVNITFNVNGVFYDRLTDVNGTAKLNINLMSGEYIITSMYGEARISNKITIEG